MENISWFKKRKVTAGFALVTFIAGFLLIDYNSISGNAVLNNSSSFEPLSLIGLLLIFCAAILAMYTIKNR
ncbi:MAG: hypothetical protein NTW17_02510 [Candidatus Pacearchaeota archaeon]|nr:hypothetical protein [Candidatus Pacearchaeota archaeon]